MFLRRRSVPIAVITSFAVVSNADIKNTEDSLNSKDNDDNDNNKKPLQLSLKRHVYVLPG